MKVLSSSVYGGPNVHALFPVIRLLLDLGELASISAARLRSDYSAQLSDCLPALAEHRLVVGDRAHRHRVRGVQRAAVGHALKELIAIARRGAAQKHAPANDQRVTGCHLSTCPL